MNNIITTSWKIPYDTPNGNNHIYSKDSVKNVLKDIVGKKVYTNYDTVHDFKDWIGNVVNAEIIEDALVISVKFNDNFDEGLKENFAKNVTFALDCIVKAKEKDNSILIEEIRIVNNVVAVENDKLA